MLKGKVKWFSETKGYGFIIDKATSERIFVHVNALEEEINVNDKVTFERSTGPKGPIAVNVQVVRL